jgi:hypothetical protein
MHHTLCSLFTSLAALNTNTFYHHISAACIYVHMNMRGANEQALLKEDANELARDVQDQLRQLYIHVQYRVYRRDVYI